MFSMSSASPFVGGTQSQSPTAGYPEAVQRGGQHPGAHNSESMAGRVKLLVEKAPPFVQPTCFAWLYLPHMFPPWCNVAPEEILRKVLLAVDTVQVLPGNSPTYLGTCHGSVLAPGFPGRWSQMSSESGEATVDFYTRQHLIPWLSLSPISLFFTNLLLSLSLATDQPSFCTQPGRQLAGEATPLH